MCDFKPGDEVVCVSDSREYPLSGVTYTVARVLPPLMSDLWGVRLVGDNPTCFVSHWQGWAHTMFRKIERRNDSLSIEAFLTIKPGFEEPRRNNEPAKRKERV